MRSDVIIRVALATFFSTSIAVVVPKPEPRDFPIVNSTRLVENTTIYYPGSIKNLRRVRSASTPVPAIVPRDSIEATSTEKVGYRYGSDNHVFAEKEMGKETKKREQNDTKKGEESCPCPCQCPTVGDSKKEKKKLFASDIVGIVLGSIGGDLFLVALVYGALTFLMMRALR